MADAQRSERCLSNKVKVQLLSSALELKRKGVKLIHPEGVKCKRDYV